MKRQIVIAMICAVLAGSLSAGPLIIASNFVAACSTVGPNDPRSLLSFGKNVSLDLDTATYAFYFSGSGQGTGLVFTFTPTTTGIPFVFTIPADPGNPTTVKFSLPYGTYQLVINNIPAQGLGQSGSRTYEITVPRCTVTNVAYAGNIHFWDYVISVDGPLIKLSPDYHDAVKHATELLLRTCERPAQTKIISLISGIADNFSTANPQDTKLPLSPALAAYSTGKPQIGFDQPSTDRWLTTSFDIGSCKTCGGMLIVKVRRPNVGGMTSNGNDSFIVGDSTNNWANNRISASVWTQFPSDLEVTFALPLPASMLNSIIFNSSLTSYLDFLLQDDTEVDFVQVLVGH